jgi:signal peptidase I
MSPDKTSENRATAGSAQTRRKDRAAEVANIFEWLITAFILAFVFRAFVMEAFRIPTGSMADTLKGAHFRLRCQQCGYKYEYGYVSRSRIEDTIPAGGADLPPTRCPSCGHYSSAERVQPVSNGDRILVLKCIYQFLEPRQWDVIVFRNPLDPRVNYIKRLVGRPEEKVEIIDGDVYINGQISRKPPEVQDELWMPVYDNDYQPVNPDQRSFNFHKWQQPFNTANSGWVVDKACPLLFHLDTAADQVNTMTYDTSIGNDFKVNYAYNSISEYEHIPYCSDLMVRFYVSSTNSQGRVGIALSKYETTYEAWIDLGGEMVIAKTEKGSKTTDLVRTGPVPINKSALVKFANVDHQLIFQFGSKKLVYDLGRGPEDAGQIKPDIPPQVKIFGSGKLTLSHIAILRDIHYTEAKSIRSGEPGRAAQGNPFTLAKDEFFVLGDNSPNSEDCRWWSEPGKANWGQSYREGIVPRDYLVGKALFVYWPSGFRPFAKSRFAVVPNVGGMRFIYGGSNKSQ